MGPGPRFEPESRDPQSQRMTAYPTPAWINNNTKNCKSAGAGIRTLVDLRQQVLSLSPLASRAPPLKKNKGYIETIKNLNNFLECSGRDSNPSLRLERPKWLAGLHHRSKKCNKVNLTWAQWGSNPWPSGYEPDALPG